MRLCKEKATGKVVAVKKLQKSEMLRRGQVREALPVESHINVIWCLLACRGVSVLSDLAVQVAHVKAERNVLAEVQNQFIVKLYYSFQVICPTRCSFMHSQARGSALLAGPSWVRTLSLCTALMLSWHRTTCTSTWSWSTFLVGTSW